MDDLFGVTEALAKDIEAGDDHNDHTSPIGEKNVNEERVERI